VQWDGGFYTETPIQGGEQRKTVKTVAPQFAEKENQNNPFVRGDPKSFPKS
jgi:hypothetical protein